MKSMPLCDWIMKPPEVYLGLISAAAANAPGQGILPGKFLQEAGVEPEAAQLRSKRAVDVTARELQRSDGVLSGHFCRLRIEPARHCRDRCFTTKKLLSMRQTSVRCTLGNAYHTCGRSTSCLYAQHL